MEVGDLVLAFFLIFASAKVLGELSIRLKMPAIVGELVAGVLLGNHVLGLIDSGSPVLMSFAEIGVVFLIFHVGLEIRVKDLIGVGRTAVLVGALGVFIPLLSGLGTMLLLGHTPVESLFVATSILATSVGISVKVLQDLGLIRNRVAYIVLGAAVLDDILALMALAVVKGLASGRFHPLEFTLLVIESIAFVVFLTWMGPRIAQTSKRWLDGFKVPEAPFVVSVILCLGLAELAHVIGLAAIIGAFMAGIVIDELAGVYDLEDKFKFVKEFLSPFFFVLMGAQLDPMVFLRTDLALLTILITVVAILSKMVGSAVGCWRESWRVKLQTGICMVPRGEVGIIVGLVGLSLQRIGPDTYAVVLGMSLLTTMITPPLIVLSFRKEGSGSRRI